MFVIPHVLSKIMRIFVFEFSHGEPSVIPVWLAISCTFQLTVNSVYLFLTGFISTWPSNAQLNLKGVKGRFSADTAFKVLIL